LVETLDEIGGSFLVPNPGRFVLFVSLHIIGVNHAIVVKDVASAPKTWYILLYLLKTIY
jgi:hypothetical protein